MSRIDDLVRGQGIVFLLKLLLGLLQESIEEEKAKLPNRFEKSGEMIADIHVDEFRERIREMYVKRSH